MTLRVVVADDHPVYREGLVALLADRGCEVVAEVGTGEAAVAAALEHRARARRAATPRSGRASRRPP